MRNVAYISGILYNNSTPPFYPLRQALLFSDLHRILLCGPSLRSTLVVSFHQALPHQTLRLRMPSVAGCRPQTVKTMPCYSFAAPSVSVLGIPGMQHADPVPHCVPMAPHGASGRKWVFFWNITAHNIGLGKGSMLYDWTLEPISLHTVIPSTGKNSISLQLKGSLSAASAVARGECVSEPRKYGIENSRPAVPTVKQ